MPATKLRSQWVGGNLVFRDGSAHRMRWLDAQGPGVKKIINDFNEPIITGGELLGWTNTAVEVGTGDSTVIAQTDVIGGAVRLDAADNENDGVQLQSDTVFYLASADRMYFGARWKISEKTQSDAFVGIAVTDTSILAGNPDDMIGFITHDGDANLDYIVRESTTGTAVDSATDLVNDTWITTELYYDGSSVYIFIDGSQTAIITANIPDDVNLRASLCYLNGAGSMQHDGIEVDWLRAIMIDG